MGEKFGKVDGVVPDVVAAAAAGVVAEFVEVAGGLFGVFAAGGGPFFAC